ncbi:MAG: hypothetical protein IKZ58_02100 [Selenomonadaceae bacterium]|nr:hypothetical protein [Selenomonadaceae bacterium]
MKKVFVTMLLAVALVFAGGSDNQAEAYRVHVGYYQDNGAAAYLLTETLAGGRSNFSCTVVTDYGEYIRYKFYRAGGGPYYKNSWGASAYVYGGESPVAERIWEWVQRN